MEVSRIAEHGTGKVGGCRQGRRVGWLNPVSFVFEVGSNDPPSGVEIEHWNSVPVARQGVVGLFVESNDAAPCTKRNSASRQIVHGFAPATIREETKIGSARPTETSVS